MDARWYLAREGYTVIKGRGAHRLEKPRPEIPADIPAAEPSLPRLAVRDLRARIRSAVSR